MRRFRMLFAVALSIALASSFGVAQEKTSGKMTHEKAEMSDAAYTAQALSAAPRSIAKGATVVRMDSDGKMRTLREGNDGFTCMVIATDKMCNDANSMEFFGAMLKGETPTDKVGISYMLAGRSGREQHRS